jgi:hypothetical protein
MVYFKKRTPPVMAGLPMLHELTLCGKAYGLLGFFAEASMRVQYPV